MTTQNEVIIICVLAFIAVPLGGFITIKTINKLTKPPVSSLNRQADIELVGYIEPSQPHNTYYPIDLLHNQFPILERISYPPTYYSGSNPPFYRSGTLPYYQSVDGININCCLENENIFNSYFIFLIIMFFVVIFWKRNSLYSMLLMIPFSTFDIDFRDSFEWEFNSYRIKPMISYLKLQTLTKDINLLLVSLLDDVNYSMSLSFISGYKEWEKDKLNINPLFIDDAIIINKESDSILITQFIIENLDKKGYILTNDLLNDLSLNSMDPVILTVTVAIKVKI